VLPNYLESKSYIYVSFGCLKTRIKVQENVKALNVLWRRERVFTVRKLVLKLTGDSVIPYWPYAFPQGDFFPEISIFHQPALCPQQVWSYFKPIRALARTLIATKKHCPRP